MPDGTPAAAPQPGQPGYEEAMIARFDQRGGAVRADDGFMVDKPAATPAPAPAPAPEPKAEEKPAELIGGKFKSVEDLLASYKELERRMSQPPAPAPAPAPATAPKADTPPTDEKPAGGDEKPADDATPKADPPKAAEVDFDALGVEIGREGKLSEASRELLRAKGIPDAIINSHEQAVLSQIAQVRAAVHEAAGGEAQFKALQEWSKTGLSDAERAFYQAQAAQGPEMAKAAISAMRQRFEAAVGKPPARQIDGKGQSDAGGYLSTAEMKADMKDPRYKNDPAFRAKVEAKLKATTAF